MIAFSAVFSKSSLTIYIYIYIHISININICLNIFTYIYIYVYICVCICSRINILIACSLHGTQKVYTATPVKGHWVPTDAERAERPETNVKSRTGIYSNLLRWGGPE